MTVQGVNGVLRRLLTDPTGTESHEAAKPLKDHTPQPSQPTKCPTHRPATKARVGRPPEFAFRGGDRQKVTFRIRPDLIDCYRDWSWDARTSLSHLVEAALDEYFKIRGK